MWPLCFECKQSSEGLQRVVASVYEVAHEYVVRVRHLTARAEQFLQVIELKIRIKVSYTVYNDQYILLSKQL